MLDAYDEVNHIHPFTKFFREESADTDWIPRAAKLGLIVITCDKRQLRRPDERTALYENGARVVFVKQRQQWKLHDLSVHVFACWPKILEWASDAQPGDMIFLNADKTIEPVR
jgi:hypothetical protein